MTKHISSILLVVCICIFAHAQTPYDSFAPETSRPILTSEALSKEKCAQDFSSDTTLLVAMIDTQQERILLVDMSDGSIVAYAPLTDNKSHWLSPDPMLDKYPQISPYDPWHRRRLYPAEFRSQPGGQERRQRRLLHRPEKGAAGHRIEDAGWPYPHLAQHHPGNPGADRLQQSGNRQETLRSA